MPAGVLDALKDVLYSGYIGEGPRVAEFERRLVPWLGTEHILALNSGTSAIHLALRLADVGPGDDVISSPMTCVATNEPILERGARVVWADIDPWTGNMDAADVARKIGPRTKAVIAVHWGGNPCDLGALNAIGREHGVRIIEDACHAFGARYRGAPVGSHSDFACFSFQAIKEITTVDGGALACRSENDAERGRLLRWYGIDRRSKRKDFRCEADIVEHGYKFHMHDVAAAIGLEQLKHVAGNLAKHRAHAARYDEAFAGLKTVTPLKRTDAGESACWLYTLRVRRRAAFVRAMDEAGITVSQVHARNDKHTIFRESARPLPGVDAFAAEHICIPVGWWLTEEQLACIIEAVCRFDGN
ncbi:MAG: DegT/DnrJ/EryC1/StrS family aminotransferase [Kiritimatiellae bacterium]|nr:DegT/DnrJ/EryC1/StrS family aminotransferase [Kiritimatiellia bacterium]